MAPTLRSQMLVSTYEDVSRAKKFEEFATTLEAQTEAFSEMLLFWARIEVQSCVRWIREVCELREVANVIEDTEEYRIIERYTSLGVAAGIVPWNFPLMLSFFKVSAALLIGNVFILKSSPFTPYCCLKVVELGLHFFPPAFTGLISTSKKILQTRSDSLKTVMLELGGNGPTIICRDVDIAAIVPKVAVISFVNYGQLFMAAKRLYVHEAIYDLFLAAIVQFVDNTKVGDGFEADSFIGLITYQGQFEREPVQKVLFITPVILDNPPEDSRPVIEELFCPILPVLKWKDESDVIRRANSTDYGSGASVWSKDMEQAKRIGSKLKAGSVGINTHGKLEPKVEFGCHKNSG
ncbi:ALDH-like protein [Xylariaceae sp. AK1471]|nr:ALDH-like protein [Xylariaceae sp. AK1471]